MIRIRPWSLIGLVSDLIRMKRFIEDNPAGGALMLRNEYTGELIVATGIMKAEVTYDNGLDKYNRVPPYARFVPANGITMSVELIITTEDGELLEYDSCPA